MHINPTSNTPGMLGEGGKSVFAAFRWLVQLRI